MTQRVDYTHKYIGDLYILKPFRYGWASGKFSS